MPPGVDPAHPGGMADNSPYGEFPIRALEFGHSADLRGANPEDCISQPKGVNPEGIASLSPGLRAARYPGCVSPSTPPTLKGLHRGPAWSILAAMPQSLARILVHTVFSTKDRRPSLRDTALRKELLFGRHSQVRD